MKKYFIIPLTLLLLVSLHLPVLAAEDEPTGMIQFITNQKTVSENGEIDYSILYQLPEAFFTSGGKISVEVPDSLSIISAANADWDDNTNVLSWSASSLQTQPSGVIDFTLQTNQSATLGDYLELTVNGEVEGKLVTSDVKIVTVGPEKHQPFFQGYPTNEFRPDSYLTRAETAAIVSRIKNLTDDSSLENPYHDVREGHWAEDYITEVTNAGYMKGYQNKFNPDEPIKRAELITLLLRLKEITPIPLDGILKSYKTWAKDEMNTAYALGYITGTDDVLLPESYVSRAESAKLLNLAFYRGELKDGEATVIQHFPDVPKSHWAFHWIEEASKLSHESNRNGQNEHLIQYLPEETEQF